MRLKQLKRLKAQLIKRAIRIDKANTILANIRNLESGLKLIKSNPQARVNIAVVAGRDVITITDCFEIQNEDLIDVIKDRISELDCEFKRL